MSTRSNIRKTIVDALLDKSTQVDPSNTGLTLAGCNVYDSKEGSISAFLGKFEDKSLDAIAVYTDRYNVDTFAEGCQDANVSVKIIGIVCGTDHTNVERKVDYLETQIQHKLLQSIGRKIKNYQSEVNREDTGETISRAIIIQFTVKASQNLSIKDSDELLTATLIINDQEAQLNEDNPCD